MSTEQWRPVVGWEGYYEVSDLGRVRSVARVIMRSNGAPQTIRERILCQQPMSNGLYWKADLSRGGRFKSCPVHRLVAAAFFGPLPGGMQTRHLNGNGFDNRLENLRYGTPWENTQDSIQHGTHRSLLMKAKTHCAQGHEFTPENTWRSLLGNRVCRRCSIDRTMAGQRRRLARREAAGEVTPHVIREWAASVGIDLAGTTGRLPNELKWLYALLNPERGWQPTPDPRPGATVPTARDLIAAYPHLEPVIETRVLKAA